MSIWAHRRWPEGCWRYRGTGKLVAASMTVGPSGRRYVTWCNLAGMREHLVLEPPSHDNRRTDMSKWADQPWPGGCWVDREDGNKPVAAIMDTDRWKGDPIITIWWVNLSGGRQKNIIQPHKEDETQWW